ncbi:hypothetical protein IFT84_15305 [Rhizobium sp. CFBP 8762]|uniref:hypothetical protein n=1 Tax=Rhizobium sp. CFBP 8762 TaxID=2775279 RepID=UPI00177D8B37|nr:hypothetical protein [Rhizobium sp. CFBP 8762]MBD8555875.1 hypothetical protein [Rhizobium sp. CFBP 8762]
MFPFKSFLKAVLFGTLAGAGPILLITVTFALLSLPDGGIKGPGSLPQTLQMVFLPLAVAFPIVLVSSLVFGIPVTFILRRLRAESSNTYTFTAGFIGMLIPLAGCLWWDVQDWICLLGFFSGAVTGSVWWRDMNLQKTPHR